MGAQFPMQRGAPHTQENAHLQSVRQCLSVFEGGATGQSIRTFQLAQPEVTHIPISTPSCQGKKKGWKCTHLDSRPRNPRNGHCQGPCE